MRPLVIIGAGGFGREVAWLIEDINQDRPTWNLLGFIDDDKEKWGQELNGYPVLGGLEENRSLGLAYGAAAVCAVGTPATKKHLVTQVKEAGLSFATLIHPSVRGSAKVEIGMGSIVCAGNIMTVNIRIGSHVILNLNCTVGHDCIIDNYATVAPGANVSGNVTIGEGCDIGTGCSIIQGINIASWSTVGAGAVVTRDIPPYCTAVGIPARPIKFHPQGDQN